MSYDELMAESMKLVPKMIRILEARGMKPSDTKLDFGAVENELGCPLPEDFKAISQATQSLTCWELTIENLYSPQKISKDRQKLEKAYKSEKSVEFDWSKDKCFVPFSRNSSAFYYGYIKDKELNQCNKIVRMDGEGSFEYNEGTACDLPLGILMYRYIVRAVTPEIWKKYGSNHTVSDFWESDGSAEDRGEGMSCSAKDGSQDHAASDGNRIVVFGRPVAYLGTPDYDEDEDEEQDFPTASVFQGASEEDFLGVGEYGVTHPLDQEEEDRQRAVDEAPKAPASVSLEGLDVKLSDLGFDSTVASLVDQELEDSIVMATLLKERISAGERSTALIGPDGRLVLLNHLDERLWYCKEANSMLESGETFTQVSIAGQQWGFALTSKNRLLQWKGIGEKKFQWVSLPEDLGPIRQLDAAHGCAALVLQDGRLALFGGKSVLMKDPTKTDIVPDIQNVVRVCANSGMLILHGDGSVSKSDPHEGMSKLDCPKAIVAIQNAGRRDLLLAVDGAVYGVGGLDNGAMPLAVTPERITAYEASQQKFTEQLKEFEDRLDAFEKEMEEHCQSCPKAAPKPAKKPRFDTEEDPRQKIMFRIQCANCVDGVQHTPEACGAPAVPESLKQGPDVPLPCETNFCPPDGYRHPLSKATILTVGSEHKRLMDIAAPLTPKDSWNYVKGPYGLACASTAPVVAVGGTYGYSVFLHSDGKLSGCGSSSDLGLGFGSPEDEEEDKEEDDDDEEAKEEKMEEDEAQESKNNAIPSYSRRLYSQKAGHCYIAVIGDIGMPAAPVLPDGTFMIAMDAGSGGALAVDETGEVWGCGSTVGKEEPGATYEVLHVLENE